MPGPSGWAVCLEAFPIFFQKLTGQCDLSLGNRDTIAALLAAQGAELCITLLITHIVPHVCGKW